MQGAMAVMFAHDSPGNPTNTGTTYLGIRSRLGPWAVVRYKRGWQAASSRDEHRKAVENQPDRAAKSIVGG